MAALILKRGSVTLRPLTPRDADEWGILRVINREWLRPWEATPPPDDPPGPVSFAAFVRTERRLRRTRSAWPLAIEVDGELAGRVVIAGIGWGAQRSGSLGYWVDLAHCGRGLAPVAAAMMCDYGFSQGLNRIELTTLPHNGPSRRVADKLGFVEEGMRRQCLYVDGAWRDHVVYARTQDQPRVGRYWE